MILCGEAVCGYVIRLVFREEKGAALERGQREDGRKERRLKRIPVKDGGVNGGKDQERNDSVKK